MDKSLRLQRWGTSPRRMRRIPLGALAGRRRGLAHMSARAVGGAVGHNAISLIIPCHRVVGADGSLMGYAGGTDKKVRLLALEKTDMPGHFVPGKGTAL